MSVLSQRGEATRFAPSPTGLLHLGHAYAALFAAEQAKNSGGQFRLRIEDIDAGRCRTEFVEAIYEDLAWLGLEWETPVPRQSEQFDRYRDFVQRLEALDLLYPCFCTRKEIQREIAAAKTAPHGPDGPIYPGTCRSLSNAERNRRKSGGDAYALRLDMNKAIAMTGPLTWIDEKVGPVTADPSQFGDVVIARKDSPASYHLAVTVDDHHEGITLVTRGEDLYASTHVHRLLQAVLKFDPPHYLHHKLILGPDGKKFSKRDQSVSLQSMRARGKTPADIRSQLGFTP